NGAGGGSGFSSAGAGALAGLEATAVFEQPAPTATRTPAARIVRSQIITATPSCPQAGQLTPSTFLESPSVKPLPPMNARSAVVGGTGNIGEAGFVSFRPTPEPPRTDPSPMQKLTTMPGCLLDQSNQLVVVRAVGMPAAVGRMSEPIQA